MPITEHRKVDHSAIRTNQTFIVTLLALGIVLDAPILAGIVAAALLISALAPQVGPFTRLYRHVLRPAGIVKPDIHVDNPQPHRFAQALGATFVSLAVVALLAGLPVLGWGLAGLVIVLASLNLFAGFCAACMLYYWLHRLGVPGFDRARVEGI
jgi:hypothetical protein